MDVGSNLVTHLAAADPAAAKVKAQAKLRARTTSVPTTHDEPFCSGEWARYSEPGRIPRCKPNMSFAEGPMATPLCSYGSGPAGLRPESHDTRTHLADCSRMVRTMVIRQLCSILPVLPIDRTAAKVAKGPAVEDCTVAPITMLKMLWLQAEASGGGARPEHQARAPSGSTKHGGTSHGGTKHGGTKHRAKVQGKFGTGPGGRVHLH